MVTNVEDSTNDLLKNAILRTLGYYALFHYPITIDEVLGNLPIKCTRQDLVATLQLMVTITEVYEHAGYYGLEKEIKEQTQKRIIANQFALKLMPKAMKVGVFIYLFPYVRFVGISGSLSKGYADTDSDFDFFIVTGKNRLWICRTLLHAFKKITFLTGSEKMFCMNYFIDPCNLQIAEKNRYTAIELASMIPVAGSDTYAQLMKNNDWCLGYLPNGYKRFSDKIPGIKDNSNLLKRFAEFVIDLFAVEKVNSWLMNCTDKKWKKKWGKRGFPMNDYDIAFKTTLHVSKNHPANHQKVVLESIAEFDLNNHSKH